MRIVRLANFVAPRSGGLRTSLAELGAGYLAAGHEPVLVIPGKRDGDERCAQGRVVTLRAPKVPFTGGYRVLWRRRRVARLLAALRPDALEVSDRTTLRWTGGWAREHGVPAVMVSHESVTALLKLTWMGPGPLKSALSRAVADWLNRRTARAYHRVICTTGWAAAEFGRIDAGNVVRVPLGVDLDTFSPRVARVRSRYVGEGQILLVHCGRLSAEKRPQRSVTTPSKRPGKKAALRGTVVDFGQKRGLVYTVGYVPFLRCYPGFRIPQPVEITENWGSVSLHEAAADILKLTKLNWNTAAFNCREPITVAFARRVGDILKLAKGKEPALHYRYYM